MELNHPQQWLEKRVRTIRFIKSMVSIRPGLEQSEGSQFP
jgi:hypothetical protein